MADCPPNLDDGELWIPSDILPDIVSTGTTPDFPSEGTYMDDLAQQLAAYALLERKKEQSSARPPPYLAPYQFGLPTRAGPVVPPGTGYYGVRYGNHRLYASGNGGYRGGSRPVYQFLPIKPAQTQVENFAQTRAWSLQRQQTHHQNRFLPCWVNRQVMGGLIRESGGTGVFLPRTATAIDSRRNKGVNNGQKTQQGQNMKRVSVKKQERIQPPAEKGLPQDWTY